MKAVPDKKSKDGSAPQDDSRKIKRIVIIAVVAVILIFFAVVIISRVRTIHRQNVEISSISQSVSEIESENSELQETLTQDEDSYMEDKARSENYVKPEERVYIDNDE